MPHALAEQTRRFAKKHGICIGYLFREALIAYLRSHGEVVSTDNPSTQGARSDLLRGREQTMRVADLTDEEIALTRRPNRGGKGRRATG